jgi:hypothetical protein
MSGWKLALAAGALALAAGPWSEASQSGAAGRHPSPTGSSSPAGSATSTSSSSGSSGGSVYVHSSGASASSRTPSRAEARHPRPFSGRRYHSPGNRGYGGYGYYYPYYYPPYAYGWNSAFYPYWGYWDGYYYGYYGWPAPYGPIHVYGDDVGSIRVQVHPKDAEVYVDGYYAGVVDDFDGFFQRLNVKAGRHEITLKLEGYKTNRVRLYVPVGGTVKIHLRMERGTSSDVTQSVIGHPEKEAESMGGDDEGHEGDMPRQAGADNPLAPGNVVLRIRPADASVYVDGEFEGAAEQVESLDLPAGSHRIEAVRPGYLTAEQDVTVKSGETATVDLSLDRKGATD